MWFPMIRVWPKGARRLAFRVIEVEVGLSFCEAHKDEFNANDIQAFGPMCRTIARLRGQKEPDLETAVVEMRPIIFG